MVVNSVSHFLILNFVSLRKYSKTAEPIDVSFSLENTIKPSITFEEIHLLWTFETDTGATYSNNVLFKANIPDEGKPNYNLPSLICKF